MKLSGEYRIPAPREAVWLALNDTGILKASIEQLEELEWTGPEALRTTVAARIGPMTARFRGTVALSDVDAPRSYVLTGQGEGGVAGFARATARVFLHDEGPETRFAYECEAAMGGRLADIGGALVKGVADKAADAFFERFASRLIVAIAAREAETAAPAVDDLPFAWGGGGASLSDCLRELEALGLADTEAAVPASAAGAGGAGVAGAAPGLVPLDARTALIAGGWVAMAGILLLLFAT